MSCAARFQETTSLEFILNPFKFFFTNYVVKNRPADNLYIARLMTPMRSHTIVAHTLQNLRLLHRILRSLPALQIVALSLLSRCFVACNFSGAQSLRRLPDHTRSTHYFVLRMPASHGSSGLACAI